jgi:hypothetical protein
MALLHYELFQHILPDISVKYAFAYGSYIIIIYYYYYYYFLLLHCSPARAKASSFTRLLDHTQRRARVGRTPLD